MASARACTLAHRLLSEGDHLHLQVDATSTRTTWEKGSKVPNMSDPILQAAVAAARRKILITLEQISTHNNRWADFLSRDPDHQNYSLDHRVWKWALSMFNYNPTVDLFASRRNAKCSRYCTRILDSHSLGDAFRLNWGEERGYANPPWEVMPKVLKKAQEDRAMLLLVCPVWRTAAWWRTLTLMQRTPLLTLRKMPLFHDPSGKPLPIPRWRTAFVMVGWSPHLP